MGTRLREEIMPLRGSDWKMKILLTYIRLAKRSGWLLALALLVTSPAWGSIGSFTISATNEVVQQGTLGSSAITVTPIDGYTGDITFKVTGASPSFTNGCVLLSNYSNVSGINPTTVGSLAVATRNFDCPPDSIGNPYGGSTIGAVRPMSSAPGSAPLGIALGGFLAVGLVGRRSHKLRRLSCLLVLVALAGFAMGCSTAAPLLTPKGTYTMTLVGTDAHATPNIAASTTFTVTVQ